MNIETMTYYLLFLILGMPIFTWGAIAFLAKDRGGVMELIAWINLLDKEAGK